MKKLQKSCMISIKWDCDMQLRVFIIAYYNCNNKVKKYIKRSAIIMDKPVKLFYSIKELATMLPISRSTLYSAVCNGKIPSKRIGSRILIPVSYLEELSK